MIKKSRLRLQKEKKGGRVILSLLIVAALGAALYQVERYWGITSSLEDLLHTVKSTFSGNGPARGAFYDRNLKQLAVTLERVSVYARTREIDSIQQTATQLGQILALDKDTLEEQLQRGALRLWIAKDISQEQELSLNNLQLPGIYLQRDEKRYYPNDFQAAHIVGYVENGIGLAGVEFFYDRLLAGRKIKQQKEQQPLSNALDLVLSLDLKIQDILETLSDDIARSEQAVKVTVYLLESGTGEIIGGVNLPGFNPNTFTRYSQEQTENMFFVPLCIPEKFRIFLRDATILYAQPVHDLSPSAWSIVPENNDLGSQLRFWDSLGLQESSKTDFHVPTQSGKAAVSEQKPVVEPVGSFGFVPESATPSRLLTTFSILLGKGEKIDPFVVKKVVDKETGEEVLLSGNEENDSRLANWSAAAGERLKSFFYSQASRGASGAYFFRDDILVTALHGGRRHYLINDVVFATLPAGSNDMHMLIVVQRSPLGVSSDVDEKRKTIEQIVEEKVERISVLQQIGKSLADFAETEVGREDNYQAGNRLALELSGILKKVEKEEQVTPGVMPDLKGFSLRKSLRLLQGIPVELQIQGTGRVVDQKPRPGTSLKGITECVLILEKQENIVPDKLPKGPPAGVTPGDKK
jgi:cell division protein FtsI (penicillin-binding protein 3)